MTLASGPLTLPYLTGAAPVRSSETVSGVAVFYRGEVSDALERYGEALTAAGFTIVSTETIPSRAATAGSTTTESSTEGAEATDPPATTEGTTAAPEGAAAGTAPTETTSASGAGTADTSTGGTAEASGGAGDAAGSTGTVAAQGGGSDRQVMILERNGERIRVSVWQMYGLTTVLLARV
ncbi:hypothetical protein [Deinococcus hohokamensis]|uniref:Uncharacterized protein n=1 Tax=Deinococcus hohokamensis TaxID=309883 RepID=A0ABV9I737_9DEIO